jgi:hypothetical protein
VTVTAEAYPLGHTVPRLYVPPLVTGPPGPCGCGCALTPETTDGFDVAEFAELVLGEPLDEWQRWLVIHALELLPDGRPRFRRVVITVARQNGKTYLLAILACFWLYVCGPINLLGSSTKTGQAIKAWNKAIGMAKAVADLAAMIPKRGGITTGAGREKWALTNGSVYEPVASNEDGGRGDSLDRVIADELRHHHDYSAYGASYHAMRARPYAQFWALTSMGDHRSVVLNDLRSAALMFMESGTGDPRLGLFEWSPEEGADPLDPHALAAANPNAGRRFDLAELLAEAEVAVAKGGMALTDFKTEAMNLMVDALDPALNAAAWLDCRVPGDLSALKAGLVMVVDVSPDMQHVTLVAGALMPDGRVRIEPAKAWEGPRAVAAAAAELPGFLARNRPRKFGWLPGGPGAALVATLRERKGRTSWPPRGVLTEEIAGEASGACMAFAVSVEAREIVHAGDPLLDAQARAVTKLPRPNDTWRFGRSGETYADAMYAAAGVVLLARTLPTPLGGIRVVVPRAARKAPAHPEVPAGDGPPVEG